MKEGRVEAKGYPLTGGGVQKNSKKLNLQLTSDGLLSLLDSGKVRDPLSSHYSPKIYPHYLI